MILARAVNAALEDTDDADAAWDRMQRKVNEEHKLLADAMARHGHSAGLTVRDGIMVVDVVFQGRSHDIPGLAEALRTEEASSGPGCCPPGNGRSWRTTCSTRWQARCMS